ncbi:MAG: aminopeptidase P family protein [Alphaproteobacteria bacterium]|nr:aminopeptidase P family protein [Alphaproteobacteria bacterium]
MLLNLSRARAIMAEQGLDAVVLATPANVLYGSGLASEFMLGHFEDYTSAVILPADDSAAALVLPEFDLPFLVEAGTWIEDIRPFGTPWSTVGTFMGETLERHLDTPLRQRLKTLRDALAAIQQPTILDAVTKTLRDRGLAAARIGCDDARLARMLEESGLGGNQGIADVVQDMRRVRVVKTPDEVEVLTRGAQINAAALAQVIAGGRAGMAERDLTQIYRRALVDLDARHLGDRGMMFGAGDGSSFSLPSVADRRLNPGEAVVLDCLGTYQGYHMDLARTAVVGDATPDQRKRYEATVAALEEVESAIKPGVHTQDLRKLVRATIEAHGLRGALTSVTTHGLGLEVFEFPFGDSLPNGFTLEQDMVVNTEVFYRDVDLGSFHLEDSVVVTENGCRLLHEVPRGLVEFH